MIAGNLIKIFCITQEHAGLRVISLIWPEIRLDNVLPVAPTAPRRYLLYKSLSGGRSSGSLCYVIAALSRSSCRDVPLLSLRVAHTPADHSLPAMPSAAQEPPAGQEPSTSSPSVARRRRVPHPKPLTIGIVGFGNFGQFLGATFAAQGHRVVGCSRGDYFEAAKAIGCEYVRDANAMLDAGPDVVVLCTSIMSLSTVLARFPVDRLAGLLVVDVLSVKEYPKGFLLEVLPESADILCTHPMFGPESARDSWAGLPFVYDVVRLSSAPGAREKSKERCDAFLGVWGLEGCAMVPMTCHVHDEYAASTQFITHTTGRMLAELDVKSTPINTRGYESLLGVVDNTTKDSFDLYYGLYRYNPNARAVLDKLETGLASLRAKLDEAERGEQAKQ